MNKTKLFEIEGRFYCLISAHDREEANDRVLDLIENVDGQITAEILKTNEIDDDA